MAVSAGLPGTVAVPMSEIGRFAMFTVSLAGTRQPPGSRLSVMASASVTENLNAISLVGGPWPLSFSYGRALQASALAAWRGDPASVEAGQDAFLHRARMNALAAAGDWRAELEEAVPA
jgi:fructose-bisphosphate aldolase class 1